MSKERLEEIKQTINHPNYTEHNGQEEIYFMVSDNDFNWLIEQAERVQELETTVDFYQSALRDADRRVQELEEEVKRYQSGRNVAVITKMKMDELEKQNKRYRDLINDINEKAMLYGVDEEVYEAIQDAIKALEGEE